MGAFALLFLLAATVLFLIAAFGGDRVRVGLVPLGLACLAIAMLLQGIGDVSIDAD